MTSDTHLTSDKRRRRGIPRGSRRLVPGVVVATTVVASLGISSLGLAALPTASQATAAPVAAALAPASALAVISTVSIPGDTVLAVGAGPDAGDAIYAVEGGNPFVDGVLSRINPSTFTV